MQPLHSWQKYGNRLWSVNLMRYRGGSEGSREGFFVSTAMLYKNISQKKEDAVIIALKGKCGFFCRALVWTEVHSGQHFDISKHGSSFRSFQQGQKAPFSSYPTFIQVYLHLAEKNFKKVYMYPGFLVEFWSPCAHSVCLPYRWRLQFLGLQCYQQWLTAISNIDIFRVWKALAYFVSHLDHVVIFLSLIMQGWFLEWLFQMESIPTIYFS